MCTARAQRAGDLLEHGLRVEDVLEHVLCDVQVDAGIGEAQRLEVLVLESPHQRSRRFSREKLRGQVATCFRCKADTGTTAAR